MTRIRHLSQKASVIINLYFIIFSFLICQVNILGFFFQWIIFVVEYYVTYMIVLVYYEEINGLTFYKIVWLIFPDKFVSCFVFSFVVIYYIMGGFVKILFYFYILIEHLNGKFY